MRHEAVFAYTMCIDDATWDERCVHKCLNELFEGLNVKFK